MIAAGTQAHSKHSLRHLQFWQQDLPRHAPVWHPLLLSVLLTWHNQRQQLRPASFHQALLLLALLLPLVCWQRCQQLCPASFHQVLLLQLVCGQRCQQLRSASCHQVLLLLLPLVCWQQCQQLRHASFHQVMLLLLLPLVLVLLPPLVCWEQCQQVSPASFPQVLLLLLLMCWQQACRRRVLLLAHLQQQLKPPVHVPHWQPLHMPAVGCWLSGMPSASPALWC